MRFLAGIVLDAELNSPRQRLTANLGHDGERGVVGSDEPARRDD